MKGIIALFMMSLMVLSGAAATTADEAESTMIWCGPNNDRCPQPCGPNDIHCGPRLDVVFVIDSTGSMADEIRTVKTHLVNIMKEVQQGSPMPILRVGVVTFRDHKPQEQQYVTTMHQLSYNVDSVVRFIENIQARGGGDYPEAVADGLDVAINNMGWNRYARKLVFLVGDAAPHGEGPFGHSDSFPNGCPDGHSYEEAIEDAIDEGVTIYTISGSGMESNGMRVWKDIAKETGGEYERLSYVRRELDVYYAEQGIDDRYLEEAKADSDYDSASNSILTNTLGAFSAKAMKAEAADMGVNYDDVEVEHYEEDEYEEEEYYFEPVVDEPAEYNSFHAFLKRVFARIFGS